MGTVLVLQVLGTLCEVMGLWTPGGTALVLDQLSNYRGGYSTRTTGAVYIMWGDG